MSPEAHPNGMFQGAADWLRTTVKQLAAVPFVRGVAVFQVGGIVMMFTGLASSVIYARLLGLQGFGLYAAVSSFTALLGIATSYGQETVLATFLSEASGRKDDAAKTAVLRYYFQATLVATAVMVLMIILTPLLTAWLHGNAEISNYIRIVLLNSILQPANLILFVVLQIGHKVARVAIIENIADVAQLAISTVLLLLGWGVMGILAGTLIVSLVTAPLYLYLYQCAARELKFPSLGEITKTLTRRDTGKYAVQGFWIAFDQNIGKNLYPNLFFVVLSATTSLQTVGIFRLAFRLAGMPLSVIMPSITRMTTVSIPRIAALNPSHLLSACKKLIFGSVGLALASGIAAAVVVPPLIPIVYGNAFAAATPLFLLLLLTNVMSATHVISVPLLRVFQRVWVLSITNVSGVAIALAAYFGLIRIMPAGFAMCLAIIIFHMNTLLLFAYLRFFLRRRDVCYHPA